MISEALHGDYWDVKIVVSFQSVGSVYVSKTKALESLRSVLKLN